MGKTAFIFPGQGAQYIGMAKEFYENCQESREAFGEASEAVGIDMKELIFTENDRLNITEYTQVAMLTAEVSILRKLENMEIVPDMTAGLSLGEYASLVAASVMSFTDAAKVVRRRGLLMQEAVPAGIGSMAAIMGLDGTTIAKVCRETEGYVSIANYNCPGQIVITGEKKSVELAGAALKENGARRVAILNVSGPFHCEMLKEAGEKLGEVIDMVKIHSPKIPYIDNTNAEIITSKDTIRELLMKQVACSVLWQQSIERMILEGVTTFIEIGPGRTLTGFLRKINRDVTGINIEKMSDLDKLKETGIC